MVSVSAPAADTLTVLFGGDVLFDRGVRTVAEQKGYDWLLSDLTPVFKDYDAVVVNLECPVTMRHRPVKKKYIFRADTTAATALAKAGVTHAALANNHSMDQGLVGLSDTYSHLQARGITAIGYAEQPELLRQPTIIGDGKIKIAVFNAVTIAIENWFATPAPGKPAVNYTSDQQVAADIRLYHSMHPDIPIVVFVHWGEELHTIPSHRQQICAAAFVAAGASAVIGQHPHVVQSPDRDINGPWIAGEAPVWYSIGNLVFDQTPEECNKAQLVELRFTKDGLAGYDTLPVVIEECRPRIVKD